MSTSHEIVGGSEYEGEGGSEVRAEQRGELVRPNVAFHPHPSPPHPHQVVQKHAGVYVEHRTESSGRVLLLHALDGRHAQVS